jgi:hypothetical protein
MIVLGADTHKRSHTIAAVAAGTGEVLGEKTVRKATLSRPHAALLRPRPRASRSKAGPTSSMLTLLADVRMDRESRSRCKNDDRRAPDARDGLRDCGAQQELSAPGFPADR